MLVDSRVRRLLGRRREQAALEQMLATAQAGHGAVMVLHGEPGVGKSALLLALLALAVYFGLANVEAPPGSDVIVRHAPMPGAVLGAVLVVVGAWQVLFYIVWRGWPFSQITNSAPRLACAHIAVIGGGVLTYFLVHVLGEVSTPRTAAVAGCFIVAGMLLGMLFEGSLHSRVKRAAAERAVLVARTVAVTAAFAFALFAGADTLDPTRADTDDWVEHAALNAFTVSIILHVGVGRRWPFAPPRAAWVSEDDHDICAHCSGTGTHVIYAGASLCTAASPLPLLRERVAFRPAPRQTTD